MIVGEKNTLCTTARAVLIPDAVHQDYQQPARTLARSPGIYQEDRCDSQEQDHHVSLRIFGYLNYVARQHSDYATGENKILEYDGANMRFKNDGG